MRTGGIGISIFLVAVGAVLAWAVDVDTEGVNLNTVGIILFIVGILGAVASIVFTAASTDHVVERDREVEREVH